MDYNGQYCIIIQTDLWSIWIDNDTKCTNLVIRICEITNDINCDKERLFGNPHPSCKQDKALNCQHEQNLLKGSKNIYFPPLSHQRMFITERSFEVGYNA